MSVERKKHQVKEKKVAPKTKRPRTRDISGLPDLVVDKKVTSPVKTRVIFERTSRVYGGTKSEQHEGFLFSVADDGGVTIWDETRGQFYVFSLNEEPLPVVKVR